MKKVIATSKMNNFKYNSFNKETLEYYKKLKEEYENMKKENSNITFEELFKECIENDKQKR